MTQKEKKKILTVDKTKTIWVIIGLVIGIAFGVWLIL